MRVALLIETSNRYGRDLLHGVHDWMKNGAGWSVRLTEQSRLAPLPDWLSAWEGDGIIARVDSTAAAKTLRGLRVPVVDVSAERATSEFPRVTINNAAVARLAVEHYRTKGLVNFAFCGDARFLWSTEREKNFVRLLHEAGHGCAVYPSAKSAVGSEVDLETLGRWLKKLPRPVGVLACFDERAQHVLVAAERAGLSVPADVAVLGVDNDEVICDLCTPPLSSVLPNARRAGYEAAAILHRLMVDRRPRKRTSLSIDPVRVVERQSTEVLSVNDTAVAAALRYIRAHAHDGINVSDVLRAVPMSRTLLERKFARGLGQSPHALIKAAKLEHAQRLLVESELPVARIADLAGFSTVSYFSAAFGKTVGETPLAYRQRRRAGGQGLVLR